MNATATKHYSVQNRNDFVVIKYLTIFVVVGQVVRNERSVLLPS